MVENHGHIEIRLNDYLKIRKISKNALEEQAGLQRTQLNAYCNNKIKRPDFDVLSRICAVLGCEISDILKYVSTKEEVPLEK